MAEIGRPMKRPARILYVENGIGYGGAVICLRHLVRNLDRTRFEPYVVTGKDAEPYRSIASEARWIPIRDRLVDTIGWQQRIEGSRLGKQFPRLTRLLQKFIGRVDDVVNFVPLVSRMLLTMLKVQPALVHTNNEPVCNRAAIVAARIAGVPVISHVRGGAQRRNGMVRRLYSIPAHFIAVSEWVSRDMAALGVPPVRRTCVYDGIELENLDHRADGKNFRRRFGIPDDVFAVGLIGLLIPWKGQRLFLDAVRMLLQRIPKLRVAIVGGTPELWREYERELRREAADAVFGNRVVFTGHLSDMAEAYNGLDVVVSASTAPEPLGTVVIEALALGRPLVAPAHGGAAEMIEGGATGLLFSPGSAQQLADCINRFYSDRALAARLGTNARERALQVFAVHRHVEQIQAIYERTLNASGALNSGEAHEIPA